MTLLSPETAIDGVSRPYVTGRMRGQWRIALVHAGWLSVLAALALSLLGVYAIDVATNAEGAAAGLDPRAQRQLVFVLVGVVAAVIVAIPSPRIIAMLAWPSMIACLGLLVFLFPPFVPEWLVKPEKGARGWINLQFFKLQPAEITKIAFVLVAARYLRYRNTHRSFLGLVGIGLVAGVPIGLITLQPDLGSAMLFVPALAAMLVAAGMRLRHLAIIATIALAAGPLMYPFLLPHQKVRIQGLMRQIQGDRTGAYDINYQSFTAQKLVGAGGIAGNSDAHSRALMEFNRLPERHNDMVFSVIVNRFGFLGGMVVIGLYLVWLLGAILTALTCKSPFGRLVPIGLAGFIATQIFVNIGMNIGLVPIIGITLPFLSAGGSSTITVWMMTGLIVSMAMRKPRPPYRPSFEYGEDD